MAVRAPENNGDAARGLPPLVDFGGEFAAGQLLSVFVKDDAEAAFAVLEQAGAFAGRVGGFYRDLGHRREVGETLEVFVAAGFGVGQGGFADGEQEEFHDKVEG